MSETDLLCTRLRDAKKPEDIFGAIFDGPLRERLLAVKHLFNSFVVLIHPDQNPGLKDAGQHVARLLALRTEAEKLLKEGTYGQPRKPVVEAVLHSRAGAYKVIELHRAGEIADLFIAEHDGKRRLLKVVRQPTDNDLLDIETRTLTELHRQKGEKAQIFRKYLPKLLDSFALVEHGRHRRVNVLDIAEPEKDYVRELKARKGVDASLDYYSLAEIRDAYPGGIDARDMAWMIRRAFEGIGWVHYAGFVHGAMLPEHVLVHPLEHGARLVGWSYAVRGGQRLTAISAARRSMYPKSVFRREPATPVLDVQLIGTTGMLLLSDEKRRTRGDAPKDVVTFLEGCIGGRFKNGWDAYVAFDEVLKKLYGKRAYRAFEMPVVKERR